MTIYRRDGDKTFIVLKHDMSIKVRNSMCVTFLVSGTHNTEFIKYSDKWCTKSKSKWLVHEQSKDL